jgi:hypothetical protein
MSAPAASSTASTTKHVTDDKPKNGEPTTDKKPAAQLEEDDEFEDFPVEGLSIHFPISFAPMQREEKWELVLEARISTLRPSITRRTNRELSEKLEANGCL